MPSPRLQGVTHTDARNQCSGTRRPPGLLWRQGCGRPCSITSNTAPESSANLAPTPWQFYHPTPLLHPSVSLPPHASPPVSNPSGEYSGAMSLAPARIKETESADGKV